MKQIKYLFLFLLMSCSSSRVMTDYDAEIVFSDFKTYAFFKDVGKGLNDFDIKRVITVLNFELENKEFKEVGNPDFYINFSSKMSEAQNKNTIGIGIGNGGFGISGGIPIGVKKLNEEFIIEFVNAETNEVIWEGVLNSIVKEQRKPEEKGTHFKEIIKKIFDNYPPKTK